MAVQVRLNDNSDRVCSQMRGNVKKALTAMGVEAVHLILNKMKAGYGKPIRQTGDLMRDVSYEVDRSGENTVDVGNTLEYGKYVHDGHAGHAVYIKNVGWRVLPGGHTPGRPYIRDALNEGGTALQNVAANALRDGFD